MIPELIERKTELEGLCRRFGVQRLEVFGSALTGAFRTQDSDLDFLVEFGAVPVADSYADRYFGLLESLEHLFGRRVDLIVSSAIKNPYLRHSLDSSKVLLYAA
jgi:predicted nucleotidyltransferase